MSLREKATSPHSACLATAEVIVDQQQESAQVWPLPAQIPELDGVRGVAILLVMICHSAMWLPLSAVR